MRICPDMSFIQIGQPPFHTRPPLCECLSFGFQFLYSSSFSSILDHFQPWWLYIKIGIWSRFIYKAIIKQNLKVSILWLLFSLKHQSICIYKHIGFIRVVPILLILMIKNYSKLCLAYLPIQYCKNILKTEQCTIWYWN